MDKRWDLQSEKATKLIQNFTQCFNFRLTNKFDHINDDNKNEKSEMKNNNNENENDSFLNSAKECKYNLIDIHQTNENNIEGIGSVLWFLCTIFLSNSALAPLPALPPLNINNNMTDNDITMEDKNEEINNTLDHVPLAQRYVVIIWDMQILLN